MKLLNCVYCHDILLVINDWRYCNCGKSASRFIKNTPAIEIIGCAKVIDIDDQGYKHLLQNSWAKVECKYVVIDGLRIQRANLPID